MKFNISITTQHHQNANLIDIQETQTFQPLFICQNSDDSKIFTCQLHEILSATNCFISPINELQEISIFVHHIALPPNPYQPSTVLDHIGYHFDHFAVAQYIQKEMQNVVALVPKQNFKQFLSILKEDLHHYLKYINIDAHAFDYSSGVFSYGQFIVASNNESVFVSHQLQDDVNTISL